MVTANKRACYTRGRILKQIIYNYVIKQHIFALSSKLSAVTYNTLKSLRKHAYSNNFKILQPKTGKFSDKNSDNFHIFAQNIDCGYSLEPPWRGSSNEYPQSMFFSKKKKKKKKEKRKIMYTPVNPSFYYIKVGFKTGQNYIGVFS